MTDESITNTEQNILEIISQHRDIHLLNIMAQLKQMSTITGQSFDKNLFKEIMTGLEKKGYIKRLVSNPETFGITEKGRNLLET